MREILFRAKDYESGEWIYGYPAIAPDDADILCYFYTYEHRAFYQHVAAINTVCQYTGLKDKNGKKVFEGDIIRYSYGFGVNDYIVEWMNGEFQVSSIPNAQKYFVTYAIMSEVIGNIFDNPELMKPESKNT